MAYTTLERVELRAGVDLSAEQEAEATALIGAAEAFIDDRTGTTWGPAGGSVRETQRVYSQRLRLRQPPVASITSVALRRATPGYAPVALGASEYELAEPEAGVLLLPAYWGVSDLAGGVWATWHPPGAGAFVTVEYERAAAGDGLTVDPRVSLAATELVVYWLQPVLGGAAGATGGAASLPAGAIKSYSVGGDLRVDFAEDGGRWGTATGGRVLGVPADLLALIDSLPGGKALLA
jgi:hypothetical protein